MNYVELREVLLKSSGVERGTGTSADVVDRSEREIGPLPGDYRDFLLEFGWVSFGHREIYGLGEGVPRYLDVLFMTGTERREGGLPAGLVPVMNDGGGNLTCLVVGSGGPHPQGCVVQWDHETSPRSGAEEVSPTFCDWLAGIIGAR